MYLDVCAHAVGTVAAELGLPTENPYRYAAALTRQRLEDMDVLERHERQEMPS